jgi:hypothetical protein
MKFKNLFKGCLIFTNIFIFTFVSIDPVFASSNHEIQNNCNLPCLDPKIFKESKVIHSLSGNKIFETTDPDEIDEYFKTRVEPQNAKLVGFAIAYTIANEKIQSEIQPKWGSGYYIKNIHPSEVCGIKVIRSSLYKGPATATMTIGEAVAAQLITETGISAEVVSATLGFNVTKTYTVSDTYSIQVPKGRTYKITAHPVFLVYDFEVWYDPIFGSDYRVGVGNALKPIGVCFHYYSI